MNTALSTPSDKVRALWQKANSLCGCMAHIRTVSGRRRFPEGFEEEEPFRVRDDFAADEAKLLSSKTLRLAERKTQVFTLPHNKLVRTRRTHTDEVIAISVIAAEMLGLNTGLVRAAAIGHDIGHVPFGHQGEEWMASRMGRPEFCHEVMGVIVAQKIERAGAGLNLTFQTLDAMHRHSGNRVSSGMTPEAWVLRYCDKVAYLFADYNDIFVRAKFARIKELDDLVNEFGENQRQRSSTAIAALIVESSELKKVSFEQSEWGRKFQRIRTLMYGVYPRVTQQDVGSVLGPVLDFLQNLGHGDPFLLLALMTDEDVMSIASCQVKDFGCLTRTSAGEIIPHLEQIGRVDLCDLDLSWR